MRPWWTAWRRLVRWRSGRRPDRRHLAARRTPDAGLNTGPPPVTARYRRSFARSTLRNSRIQAGVVRPGPGRDQRAVDHGLARPGRSRPAACMSSSSAGYAVTRRPRRLSAAAVSSGPWQIWATGLSASKKALRILRSSGSLRRYSGARPPGMTRAAYCAGVDLGEREVRRPGVAGLLGVGVEAGLEVVDHELELLAGGGRDMDLVALLAQPLVGVEDLQ